MPRFMRRDVTQPPMIRAGIPIEHHPLTVYSNGASSSSEASVECLLTCINVDR